MIITHSAVSTGKLGTGGGVDLGVNPTYSQEPLITLGTELDFPQSGFTENCGISTAKVAPEAGKLGDTRVLVSHIDSFLTGGAYTSHLVFCDWG